MYYPGEFRYGGGHVIEDLVAGKTLQLFALSYGTDDYPRREIRTYFTIHDLNQAIMVNPRNCYQNYNVAINDSERTIYTYLGILEPGCSNATYCSAGQLSPLLNDPLLRDHRRRHAASGWPGRRGTSTPRAPSTPGDRERTNGVPIEGRGHPGADRRHEADAARVRPRREPPRLRRVAGPGRRRAHPDPQRGDPPPHLGARPRHPGAGDRLLRRLPAEDRQGARPGSTTSSCGRGEVELLGKKVEVGSLSSYYKALEIGNLLADEIEAGRFLLSAPSQRLPLEQGMQSLNITGAGTMITKKIYLYFPKSETEKPIVYHLVKDYDLVVNIFRAKVTPEEEGYLSLDVSGTSDNIDRAFAFLKGFDVVIHAGNKGVHWDADRCAHCGACVVHCPTQALHLADRATRTIGFCEDNCVECLACIAACPFGACSSAF